MIGCFFSVQNYQMISYYPLQNSLFHYKHFISSVDGFLLVGATILQEFLL